MYKIITGVFLYCLSIGCNQQLKIIPEKVNNEKLVTQYFEHFNKHEWLKMANMYTEIAAFKDPSLGSGIVMQTKKQIIEKYTQLSKIFPDVHDQIVQVYTAGNNHVVVEFISTGTGPNNVKFTLPICTILTIENGLITKDFTYFDNFE
jgi:predicted SnoaL-like aldol condensation-catalyzing enzyme